MSNLDVARRAMAHLEHPRREMASKAEYERYYATFFACCTDDLVFWCPCPPDTPYFGGEVRGKQALIDVFTGGDADTISDITQERWPLEYIDCGNDRVIVLGSESYRLKRSGKIARNKEYAFILDFRDGLIARYKVIQDLTEFYLAALGK